MDRPRELFAGYIPGTIRSLKNSRRLVYPRLKGGGMTKPKFIPSKAYKKWEAQALASLIHQLQARRATGHRYPIDQPVWVKAYIVYSGNEPDLSNALEGVADVLQRAGRSEEHTSELQSRENLVCRLLLEKKKKNKYM